MTRPVTPVLVSEVFGPTVQGEGALVGVRTLFVRVGGCDYRCAWCDSLYAVLPEHRGSWTKMTPADILAACEACAPSAACPWVTLSGGNPALFPALEAVVVTLQAHGYKVAVETQGSAAPLWLARCEMVTLSPKPPSSGMDPDLEDWALALRVTHRTPRAVKLVVFDDADLDWAARFVADNVPATTPLYLSAGTPQGLDDEATRAAILDRTRWLVGASGQRPALVRATVLPQLHVLLWGTQRGK